MAVGTTVAWAVTSSTFQRARFLRALPLIGLFIPSLLKVQAWILLYSPNIGLVNTAAEKVFGLQHPPFDIYSMWGMIAVQGITAAPIAYVILLAPLQALDRSLSEASLVSGAGLVTTLRRIVIPILRPAILSATILIVILVASSFETPILIGLPARVETYMTVIYLSMQSFSDNHFNIASAQASIYLVVTGLLLFVYLRGTRREQMFIAVTGRGNVQAVVDAPVVRILMTAVVVIHLVVAVFGPLILDSASFLAPFYTVTQGNPFRVLTLANYQQLFQSPSAVQAMTTSGVLSLAVVLGTLFAGGLLSFISLKSKARLRSVAQVIGMGPIAIPAMVFSIGLLLTTLSIPVLGPQLYGTPIPMLVADVIIFMPFVLRLLSSALIQIQDELLEASTLAGASLLRTIRLILLPILRPALLYAAAIVFILSYKELGAAILLISSNTLLIPTVTFGYWTSGGYNVVAALNMLTLLVPLGFLLLTFIAANVGRRPRSARPIGLSASTEGPAGGRDFTVVSQRC